MKQSSTGGLVTLSKTVNHSGMDFIDDNCFHIESSPQYNRLRSLGVKSVEFVRTRGKKLIFVEAKPTFPNPNNLTPNPAKENKTGKELFQIEITKICKKFTHSLNLYAAAYIGMTKEAFPSDYIPSEKVSLEFVLVINSFQKSWCDEIERALKIKIFESFCMAKIWKPQVSVMNHEYAKKWNIIV
jgi:hypothetical protein